MIKIFFILGVWPTAHCGFLVSLLLSLIVLSHQIDDIPWSWLVGANGDVSPKKMTLNKTLALTHVWKQPTEMGFYGGREIHVNVKRATVKVNVARALVIGAYMWTHEGIYWSKFFDMRMPYASVDVVSEWATLSDIWIDDGRPNLNGTPNALWFSR